MGRIITSDTIGFDEPAKQWLEALPIGSGRLGGMVWGGITKEIISINEDTLWCGKPETKDNVYRAKDNGSNVGEWAREVTKAAKNREYVKAFDLAMDALSQGGDSRPYSTFGDLIIEISNSEAEDKGSEGTELENARDYKRYLNMKTAAIITEYTLGGNRIERKCFASVPDDCIVCEVVSKQPINISIGMQGGCITDVAEKDDSLVGEGRCYTHTPDEGGNAIKFVGRAGIYTDEANSKGSTSVTGVTKARIIFNAVSNYREVIGGVNSGKSADTDIEAPQITDCKLNNVPEMYERHIAEYQPYYERVRLKLEEENTIYETLFNYGRYLMIAASRPGSQPANLQGVWNNMLTPPWNCTYTININTEMNYWLTGPCGLHEMAEPLLMMMEGLCESGKVTAHNFYGVEGTCSFHNTNLWRKSTVAWGNPMWNCWSLGSQWLCRNLFEECLYTNDYEYMVRSEKVLRENLRFCLNMAVKTDKGYALCPGTSPENEFWWKDDSPEISLSGKHVNHPKSWDDWMAPSDDGCRKVAVGEYSENENAIFRNLCRDYIELCEMIDKSADSAGSTVSADENELPLCGGSIYKKAKEILPEIVPVQIDSRGRIMEWNEEMPECDEHHRHLSHLYELHPGRGITENDTELFTAVRKSLESRGDEGTGWSLAWKLLMWARMKDGEHEEGLLRMFARPVGADPVNYTGGGGIYPNMFCAHPPFQIDGNYGFSAGVAEMLVQSHEDYIHILPALPPSWKKGSVKGLRCRGGVSVDISWDGDNVKVDFHESDLYTGATQIRRTVRYRIGNGPVLETKI